MRANASFWTRLLSFMPLLLLLASPGLPDGSIEGHWVLVEQNYGEGKANLAPQDMPVHLEFYIEGTELSGKVWAGERRGAAIEWPAFDAGDGQLPLQIAQRRIDSQSGIARAEYEVPLPNMEGLVLQVLEEYRVTDKGQSLIGMVRISFVREGEPAGSYVLHRRFERRP